MLECYTPLGALARETTNVRLGALVTGNTYRNPALLAKIVTTLDIVSGGRAQLGIGAGWFELEHDVARLRVRHVHRPLREARGGAADHPADAARRAADARRQALPRCDDAINQPAAGRPHPGDDRRRRRAQDAAHGGAVRRRVEPHLPRPTRSAASSTRSPPTAQRLGRDRSEITVSKQLNVCIAPTHDEAYAEVDAPTSGVAASTSTPWTRRHASSILSIVTLGRSRRGGRAARHRARARRRRLHLQPAGQRPRSPTASSCSARRHRRCWPAEEAGPGRPTRPGQTSEQ